MLCCARRRKKSGERIYDQFSLGRCQLCHQRDDLLQAIWTLSHNTHSGDAFSRSLSAISLVRVS